MGVLGDASGSCPNGGSPVAPRRSWILLARLSTARPGGAITGWTASSATSSLPRLFSAPSEPSFRSILPGASLWRPRTKPPPCRLDLKARDPAALDNDAPDSSCVCTLPPVINPCAHPAAVRSQAGPHAPAGHRSLQQRLGPRRASNAARPCAKPSARPRRSAATSGRKKPCPTSSVWPHRSAVACCPPVAAVRAFARARESAVPAGSA